MDQEKFIHFEIDNLMFLSCSRDLEAFVLTKWMGDQNIVIIEKLVEEFII